MTSATSSSPFWTYFHDRLRFGLIDKPGPLQALAKGLALRLDTVRDDAVFLRAQMFPQLCEPELLPAYGMSRGITRHHTETPEQFRSRVLNAYAWHLLGGKQEGLPEILQFYGFSVERIDNLRRYHTSRWAEFQVGLAAGGDVLETLDTLVWLINEYKPARSVLARMYSDVYNVTPLIWSQGSWSNHYYSLFSGVPASGLSPDLARYPGLILSFGRRDAFEAVRTGDGGQPVFCGRQHTGFVIPYISAPVWSWFRYGDGFPQKHGFTVGQLYSADWSEAITRSYPWTGAWDNRRWAEFAGWDRVLPKWEMRRRDVPRSGLVYGDPFLGPRAGGTTSAGGAASAGRWGGLNACWSVPAYIRVGRPIRWGSYRWSAGTDRRLIAVLEQRIERSGLSSAAPAVAAPAPALIRGFSGAAAVPLHEDAWSGAWDARRWYEYTGDLGINAALPQEIVGASPPPSHKDTWTGAWDFRRWEGAPTYFSIKSIPVEA
jgi:hypothetical protein